MMEQEGEEGVVLRSKTFNSISLPGRDSLGGQRGAVSLLCVLHSSLKQRHLLCAREFISFEEEISLTNTKAN